jgi:hypothetical protein
MRKIFNTFSKKARKVAAEKETSTLVGVTEQTQPSKNVPL